MTSNYLNFDRDQGAEPMQLRSAILLYDNGTGGAHIATLNPIRINEQGAPLIEAGRPLRNADVARLLTDTQARQFEWVDEHTLAVGSDRVVWYVPAAKRTVWFGSPDGTPGQDFGGLAPVPGLIFHATRHNLRVAAYSRAGRPGPHTPLFHAPLPNIASDGGVCMGNATIPESRGQVDWRAWSEVFFQSRFTHAGHDKALVKEPSITEFWRRLIEEKPAVFPRRKLSPMNLTLEAFLQPRSVR